MASGTVETICFQDEIPVILNTSLELETHIKVPVYAEKDQTVAGHLKKGDSVKFAKTIFYFLRGDTYCNCYSEVSGKQCNLKDGEGLQVPCKITITGQKKIVNILKHELQKINEL